MPLSGHLRVEACTGKEGKTFINGQAFSAPYHLSKPFEDGNTLCLQIAQVSGGILTGDELKMEVTVRPSARLRITTPSATRVMTMPKGKAVVKQAFHVEKDGWLEVWPESLVPHRDSALDQHTRIRVEEGGELRYMEMLAPGRVAHGETLEWKSLHLHTRIQEGKTLLLQETLSLDIACWQRWAALTQTPSPWLANVYLIRPKPWSAEELFTLRAVAPERVLPGITQLSPGALVVRVIAGDGLSLRDYLEIIRKTADHGDTETRSC